MRRPTSLHCLTIAVALAACAHAGRSAIAQSNSLFGSRGPSSLIGSNLNGSNVGIGTTQGGPTFMGLDGNAVGTGGQLGAGVGPTGGNIVGRDDSVGRFVGDQRFQQFGQGGNSGGGSRDFGNRGRGGNGGNRNANSRGSQNWTSGGQRQRASIRPRQRIAFSYPQRATETVNVEITQRLRRIALMQSELADVDVTIDAAGLATITGTVDAAPQSRLAELLVRLEPGVRSVHNELAVVGE